MNRPTIRKARGDERDRVAAVMTVTFSADPFMRWVYPKAEDYLQHFPGFVERFAIPQLTRHLLVLLIEAFAIVRVLAQSHFAAPARGSRRLRIN